MPVISKNGYYFSAKRWLCFALILWPLILYGQDNLPAKLASAIEHSGFDRNGIGLYIQGVDSAKPLVALHPHAPLNPASVIKLITTAASLALLGPNYRWTNEVWYLGNVNGDTLKGDIYFRSNGDPYLTPERFWRLLNQLPIYGIQTISGNIILDNSYFAPEAVNYGAFDDQPYRTYHVGPSAILVGFQATEFHFTATSTHVTITPFPASPKLRIINNIKLINGNCGAWQKRLSIHAQTVKDILQVTFSGRYARACAKQMLYRRVTESQDHFQHFFLPLWRQLGGKFEGSIRQGTVPENAKLVIKDTSITLAEAIRYINKFSNNVMTRQVLLSIGAQIYGSPGTTAKGIAAVKTWLKQQQLDGAELHIDNGAGLSRNTRVSAALLGRLLHFIFQQAYMPEFIASLPVSGYDGTMALRFRDEPLVGHAHIKTGLLDFVRAMAGYVTTTEGKRYVVVLLINNPLAHTKAGERLQNQVIRWTFNHNSDD